MFSTYEIWQVWWPHDQPRFAGDEMSPRPAVLLSPPALIAAGKLIFMKITKSEPVSQYVPPFVRIDQNGPNWPGTGLSAKFASFIYCDRSEQLPDSAILFHRGAINVNVQRAILQSVRTSSRIFL